MIDIHSHILPEVDDGSFDMICSIEMAEMAAESGVEAMIATPHCNQRGCFENYTSEELLGRFRTLKSELKHSDVPLELYLGMEVFGTEDAAELYRDGRLLTLNGGRYMLTEFDFGAEAHFMDTVLYNLLNALPTSFWSRGSLRASRAMHMGSRPAHRIWAIYTNILRWSIRRSLPSSC